MIVASSENSAPYDSSFMHYLRERTNGSTESKFRSEMYEFQQSYFAGGVSRFLPMPPGVGAIGTDADFHYLNETRFFLAVERARYEDRENMVFGQGVNRLVSNVMQNGFVHDGKTPDEGFNNEAKAEFAEYCGDPLQCDYEGERTFAKMAELAFRAIVIDGDQVLLPHTSGTIQSVENHHLRNPYSSRYPKYSKEFEGIVHGVELKQGKRVAYWLTPQRVGWMGSSRFRSFRYPARNRFGKQVWHVYNPKRVSQRRGVTAIAPIMFPTKYHDDLQFAALVNAKRQSFYAIIKEWAVEAGENYTGKRGQQGTQTEVRRADGSTQTNESGTPGSEWEGLPGQSLKGFSPNVPGQSHFEHAYMLMNIMAINLDLPMIVFFLDATKGNFNNYRGVIDQSRMKFRQLARDLVEQFHGPAYNWWLRRKIASDSAYAREFQRLGDTIFRHRWTPKGWPYLQPVQDAQADILRLDNNLISPSIYCSERSYDWEDLSTQIVTDRKTLVEKAIAAALEINNRFGQNGSEYTVTWRELAYGRPGGGLKLNLSGQLAGSEFSPSDASTRE